MHSCLTGSDKDFFLDYRMVDMKPNEVLVSVFLPFTRPLEFMHAYKQSRRRDDDIAIVNAAFRVKVMAFVQFVDACCPYLFLDVFRCSVF